MWESVFEAPTLQNINFSCYLLLFQRKCFSLPPHLKLPLAQDASKISVLLCKAITLNSQISIWKVTNLSEHQNMTLL